MSDTAPSPADTGPATSPPDRLAEALPALARESSGAFTLDTFEMPPWAVRRAEVDAKHALVARLLADAGCDALLLLDPANVRWFTAGAAVPAGAFGRDEWPALYLTATQRHLVASAVDSPRLFADDLDGLGFQLKEWAWFRGREPFLGELVVGKQAAADVPFQDCVPVGTFLASIRRRLTGSEAERLDALGLVVAHAVEATARTMARGETEWEVAGHLAYRLLRHGAEPVHVDVSGDGRHEAHPRRRSAEVAVRDWCLIRATAGRDGLHATASRAVHFGPPPTRLREAFDTAIRVGAAYLAATTVGDKASRSLEAGKLVLRPTPFEHDWRTYPPVHLTGAEPSEGVLLPGGSDRWTAGWAAVWSARAGPAVVADTFRLAPAGWSWATVGSEWPLRRVVIRGAEFDRPDLLVRDS